MFAYEVAEDCETSCCENGKPVVLTMLYTGDDCDATTHMQDPEKVNAQQVIDGVRMTRDEFIRILSGYGVTSINPQPGDEFNPGDHEAMMQQPSDDFEPGTITMSMGVGYKLGDRVVRPAKVAVAAAIESEDNEGS